MLDFDCNLSHSTSKHEQFGKFILQSFLNFQSLERLVTNNKELDGIAIRKFEHTGPVTEFNSGYIFPYCLGKTQSHSALVSFLTLCWEHIFMIM